MMRSGVGIACFLSLVATSLAEDWPQWMGPQRDGVWRETGILDVFTAEGPKINWRLPIGGGYAGPAVAGGKVFVTDRQNPPAAADPTSPPAKGAPQPSSVSCA